MNPDSGILCAYNISPEGVATELKGSGLTLKDQAPGFTWVHLDINESESHEWLTSEFKGFDNIVVEALLAHETRPRILEYENGVMLILRGVNLNQDAHPEDMVSIRLWIDQNRIISVRRRPLKAVSDLRERIIQGAGPKNTGEFLVQLVGRLFERMEPVFSALDEALDDVEEAVMEAPDASYRSEITGIRKQAIMFRRYIAPQRDVLAALRASDHPWLNSLQKRHLQESLDRVIRYVEDIDTIRERAQIVKDELTNALSDKMNRNLYMLSVIAAIFLPLGFFTGLLGINVGGIPGSENPAAFLIFCAMLIVVVILQIVLFKKFKWF